MIEHAHKDVCFLLSCSNEAYSGSMIDNRERECDALWGWLRGVVEEGYPAVLLGKELMSREERSRVSIGSHSKKNQIKDREAGGILLGEFADELFFVSIGKLLQIVEKRRIDGMDVSHRDRDVGKQMGGARRVIGIGVIKGYRTLIDIEDLPKERSYQGIIPMSEDDIYHLSHLTNGLSIRSLSVFGREPPDRAMVNLPFFSRASFCA